MERAPSIDIYLLLFAGTLLLFLLSGAVVGFIWIYRRRLSKQQTSIRQMHNRLQVDVLNNNIQALETERKRFAADLHDDIGGKLSALRLHLVQIGTKVEEPEKIDTIVAGSKEIIDAVIANVRRISHNLLPPSLELFGLANAIEELCNWINTSSGLVVSFDNQWPGELSDQQKKLAVYRIVQELFSNTIRHAQAKNVQLICKEIDNKWLLRYKDDGIGISHWSAGKAAGLGFRNIEDRVKLLKGTLQYTRREKGFECTIHFPAN